VLACSDCYARSAASTYGTLGGLAALSIVLLLAAIGLRRRRAVRRAAAIVVTGLVVLLISVGLALPAMPVSGWQSQPQGPNYELVCGSGIHASLEGWTAPAGDATEARDRVYCSHWGHVHVHLGEGVLGAACFTALVFVLVVGAGPRVSTVQSASVRA
jgi:hypothetical protein